MKSLPRSYEIITWQLKHCPWQAMKYRAGKEWNGYNIALGNNEMRMTQLKHCLWQTMKWNDIAWQMK